MLDLGPRLEFRVVLNLAERSDVLKLPAFKREGSLAFLEVLRAVTLKFLLVFSFI